MLFMSDPNIVVYAFWTYYIVDWKGCQRIHHTLGVLSFWNGSNLSHVRETILACGNTFLLKRKKES